MEGYFVDDAQKRCPNCQAALPDKAAYCSQCGQKQTTGRIKLRTLLAEFFETVFNLESRFFRTLSALFIPGKLTEEFFKGRHQRYFRPIRLFFVMAIIHFAVIAYVVDNAAEEEMTKLQNNFLSQAFRLQFLDEMDTLSQEIVPHFTDNEAAQNAVDSIQHRMRQEISDSTDIQYIDWLDGGLAFKSIKLSYQEAFVKPLDEVVQEKELGSRIARIFLVQGIRVMRNLDRLLGFVISNLTWMILLMMPALALILKLLYIRRDFYFVEHLIFSFHYHAFAFLIASPAYLLINVWPGAISLAFLLILIYLFWAMRRLYKQGIIKTGLKFLILNGLYSIIFIFFLTFMVLISTLVF